MPSVVLGERHFLLVHRSASASGGGGRGSAARHRIVRLRLRLREVLRVQTHALREVVCTARTITAKQAPACSGSVQRSASSAARRRSSSACLLHAAPRPRPRVHSHCAMMCGGALLSLVHCTGDCTALLLSGVACLCWSQSCLSCTLPPPRVAERVSTVDTIEARVCSRRDSDQTLPAAAEQHVGA